MRRFRRVLTGGLATAAAVTAAVLLPATGAAAHGSASAPGSRTYLCYLDGHWTGGDLDPRNPACQDAVAQGGKQPLWDWYGVLRSDGGGRTRGFIPDGQLCSGGNPKYAAFDAARDDWPATHLTSGAGWTFRYAAWVPHPGTFSLFVTKDSYDPTQPLGWDDLEDQPFSTFTETTPNGDGEYSWTVTLPANKTGRHIIYALWVRSDSQENFYSCSDVVFDGGNGEVTGFPQDGAPGTPSPTVTTPTPTPTSTPTPTATSPSPTSPSPTGSAGTPACTVQVSQQVWSGGYLGTVTVLNGTGTVQPWTVGFQVAEGVTLSSGWNATVTQSGTTITAEAPSWNSGLLPGEEVSVGFVVSGPADPPPSAVTLNGVACQPAQEAT